MGSNQNLSRKNDASLVSGTEITVVGGVASTLFCQPMKPLAGSVENSTLKYCPVEHDHERLANPGAPLAIFKASGMRAPRPTTGTGRHASFCVPSPHWP